MIRWNFSRRIRSSIFCFVYCKGSTASVVVTALYQTKVEKAFCDRGAVQSHGGHWPRRKGAFPSRCRIQQPEFPSDEKRSVVQRRHTALLDCRMRDYALSGHFVAEKRVEPRRTAGQHNGQTDSRIYVNDDLRCPGRLPITTWEVFSSQKK